MSGPLPRGWRIVICSALVLAAASVALSAVLFTSLQDVSRQGCERQNHLRQELNVTLAKFHEPPRFARIDCKRVTSLHLF